MTDTTRPTVIEPGDMVRIRFLCMEMPFGGTLPPSEGVRDTADLLTFLEALKRRLEGVAAKQGQDQAELERLRTLMGGGRALLAEMLTAEVAGQ